MLSLLTINENLNTRMIYLIPVLVLFFTSWVLFTVEYDKQRSVKWKQKEKKIIEKVYSKFVREYYEKK